MSELSLLEALQNRADETLPKQEPASPLQDLASQALRQFETAPDGFTADSMATRLGKPLDLISDLFEALKAQKKIRYTGSDRIGRQGSFCPVYERAPRGTDAIRDGMGRVDPALIHPKLKEAIDAVSKVPRYSLDLETKGLVPKKGQVTMLNLASGPLKEKAWAIPITEDTCEGMFECIEPITMDPTKEIVGHGLKFEHQWFWINGKDIRNKLIDTELTSYLRDENDLSHALKEQIKKRYGIHAPTWKEMQVNRLPGLSKSWNDYCLDDVIYPLRIAEEDLPLIDKWGMSKLFHEMEMPTIRVLARMEANGVPIDTDFLRSQMGALGEAWKAEAAKFTAMLGRDVLVSSPEDVAKALYYDMKLPYGQDIGILPGKKTNEFFPGGIPTTNEEALKKLRDLGHAAAKQILEVRSKQKEEQFFYGLLEKASANGGWVWPSFLHTGTVTTRFCVAPDTVLETSAGPVEIAKLDLKKRPDITIRTHRGHHKRILFKTYKGKEAMYKVTLTNGASITCTARHRFWTPLGWKELREVGEGGYVWADPCTIIKNRPSHIRKVLDFGRRLVLQGDRRWQENKARILPGLSWSKGSAREQNREVCAREDRQPARQKRAAGNYYTQRGSRALGEFWGKAEYDFESCSRVGRGEAQGGPENKGKRSDEGRGAEAAGILCCSLREHQDNDGAGFGFGGDPTFVKEQIASIEPVGVKDVWDITVEGDCSYVAQGFVNHNSCITPNLQQVPRPDKSTLRKALAPKDGWRYVAADFSQIELRLVAHCSQDPTMLKIYREGGDIHKTTAAQCGCPRQIAKPVNFGLIYRMAWKTLQATLYRESDIRLSEEEARIYCARYMDTYYGIPQYHKKVEEFVKQNKYVNTMFGHRRRLAAALEINEFGACTQGINFTIQGSAASITKLAMRNIDRRLEKERLYDQIKIMLQVHDEIGARVHPDIADYATQLIKEEMERCVQLSVPILAEAHHGPNWYEAK